MHKYIIYLIFIFINFYCSPRKEATKVREVLGLQKMSELATAEYVVTKIIKANDNKTWYKIGDRKILMTCRASLVAGIDMSEISEKNIQIEGSDKITLSLPHAHLLYINIKPEDVKIAYEDVSIFRTRFTSGERDELASQAERQLKQSADSLGVIASAEVNATLFIDNFLKKAGFKDININFLPGKSILQ